jgi:hypothetical protein
VARQIIHPGQHIPRTAAVTSTTEDSNFDVLKRLRAAGKLLKKTVMERSPNRQNSSLSHLTPTPLQSTARVHTSRPLSPAHQPAKFTAIPVQIHQAGEEGLREQQYQEIVEYVRHKPLKTLKKETSDELLKQEKIQKLLNAAL